LAPMRILSFGTDSILLVWKVLSYTNG
jgi:hypothetical protein